MKYKSKVDKRMLERAQDGRILPEDGITMLTRGRKHSALGHPKDPAGSSPCNHSLQSPIPSECSSRTVSLKALSTHSGWTLGPGGRKLPRSRPGSAPGRAPEQPQDF